MLADKELRVVDLMGARADTRVVQLGAVKSAKDAGDVAAHDKNYSVAQKSFSVTDAGRIETGGGAPRLCSRVVQLGAVGRAYAEAAVVFFAACKQDLAVLKQRCTVRISKWSGVNSDAP